jgi:hypothetical protein
MIFRDLLAEKDNELVAMLENICRGKHVSSQALAAPASFQTVGK